MMMFDWNNQDQVEGTLWPDLLATEDHIVPRPMESKADTLFSSENYEKHKSNESSISSLRLTEQPTEVKKNNLSNISESSSDAHKNEENISSMAEIDSWLDFPNLCMELENKCNDGDNHNSMTGLMNDLMDANNMNSIGGDSMQLDCDPDLISHEDRLNEDFLDSVWANFQDFDDIENLFRKDESIFGQEMIDNTEGFLSQSKDVINSTAQSFPMPDLPLCKDETPDDGCCSFLLDDHSEEQASPLPKEKVDGQKIRLASEMKAEEKGKNKLSHLNDIYRENQLIPNSTSLSSVTNSLHAFQSNTTALPMQLGESKLAESHSSSNHVSFIKRTYPTYPFCQKDGNRKRHVLSSNEVRLEDAKRPKFSKNLSEPKLAIMTPQEKTEKLRRLQKVQAQIAIEQQHQQYSHQISPVDESARKVLSSEQDESKTIYYRLHEVVEKLDMRTRFCIQDSLLRLAKSAAERQGISDRSSTNKSNNGENEVSAVEEFRHHDRSSMLEDTETDTNPIDRIVANLLFQRPTGTFPRLSPYGAPSST